MMAPRRGFEPLTFPLGGECAIQLCHRGKIKKRDRIVGFLLRKSQANWYRGSESNRHSVTTTGF